MKSSHLNPVSNAIKFSKSEETGSAIIIALFVMILVGAFAVLALTRISSEAAEVGNETAQGRTFYAAQASLETMTRNFNKVFETKLNPSSAEISAVRTGVVPGLDSRIGGDFDFSNQEVDQTSQSQAKVLNGGPYSGLYALRDTWRLRTTVTDTGSGTQVQLTRNILNNRIPIFQFGIFYEDDLELFRPPLFSFGGRVHSNRHFFISPGSEGVYFDSRVTAHGYIVTQTWRNGYTGDSSNNRTFIKNASGVNKQLLPTEGSVLNGTPNVFAGDPDMPPSRINPSWSSASAKFDGNLVSQAAELKLPLKVAGAPDLTEMIRRGKNPPNGSNGGDMLNNAGTVEAVTTATADGGIMRSERFANKTGIRISLADEKRKLPGCATSSGAAVLGPCGIRLDGYIDGQGGNPVSVPSPLPSPVPANMNLWSRGYQPKAMKLSPSDAGFGYVPTRVNGERFFSSGQEVWIKVETVTTNVVDGSIVTKDITEEILSLGITEQAPSALAISNYTGSIENNGTATSPSFNITATSAQTASTYPDSRSIIKLQRFAIPGPAIPNNSATSVMTFLSSAGGINYVRRFMNADSAKLASGCSTCTASNSDPTSGLERWGHLKLTSSGYAVVPFPIEFFDTREGLYYDLKNTTYYSNSNFDSFKKVPWNGVMSMVDIDVANLRRFLRGDFNGLFPTGTTFESTVGHTLLNTDIPSEGGWVVYISDRRGDADFDGKYDMEDVYGNPPGNDGVMQKGEDLDPLNTDGNGILNTSYGTEAPRYRDAVYSDIAAVKDHQYYRRGVRLIYGTTVPGAYDSSTPSNTKGFTLASENGVYIQGNLNATGVVSVPATGNTPYDQYLPFNTSLHIPTSIAADSVTILSNSWMDANSFLYPYDKDITNSRWASDTTIRFAMIAGDTIPSLDGSPDQGGISPRLNGGVHNFKRFLEKWTGDDLNYAGSLINLFNSHNNNGAFKCCNTVYDPPRRNWVFDSTFLDPTRLPPGTPFFQYVQTTGFDRTNN